MTAGGTHPNAEQCLIAADPVSIFPKGRVAGKKAPFYCSTRTMGVIDRSVAAV
jgi:hypothetical protein